MNRKITRLARGVKCGSFGASGFAAAEGARRQKAGIREDAGDAECSEAAADAT